MPEHCTCGALLPPDALFCHKCGKPQRDIVPAEIHEPHQAPPPVAPVYPAEPAASSVPINFHNRVAVRSSLFSAGVASLLMMVVPMPPLLQALWALVWMVASGFIAVYIYHRRTGEFLSARSGVRVGWITGVFCFAIGLIRLATGMVAVTTLDGGLAAVYREQMANGGQMRPEMEDAVRMLDTPSGMATIIGVTVIFLFMMTTGLPMLGGALGAKVLEKE